MSGLLINYAGVPHEISSLFPDNGLAILAAALEEKNQKVRILDFSTTDTIRQVYTEEIRKPLSDIASDVFGPGRLDQRQTSALQGLDDLIIRSENRFLQQSIDFLNRHIKRHRIVWVGFKLWMGAIRQSMTMAAALKKTHPRLRIFGGGPGADLFQEAILQKYPFIDALVLSEGEQSLPLLVEWLGGKLKRARIPGILYRDGIKIRRNPVERITDLNHLPYPVYDPEIYPAMAGDGKMKILCFDDGRGCPMGCAFCPGTAKFGTTRIEKTADRCVAELEHLTARHGVTYYRFSGSNTSAGLLSEIADRLLSRSLDITFAVFTSALGLTAAAVRKLARAGLYSIFTGIESVDDHQRKHLLGKSQSIRHLTTVFEACRDSGVFISTSVIHPAPFASGAILEKNLDYLVALLKGYENCSVALYPAGLYPHTKWFERLEDFGFSLQGVSREAYIETLLDYRYNIVLPRYLWKDLPYALNGRPFKHLLMETNELATHLQQHGILTYLVEANLMMAPALGYRRYKDFARDSNIAFFSGDASRLEQWNEQFNRIQKQPH
ncbi:MAG: B12-binding domain-containing radical SAM protein [Thermodesulfobacteriota bacterium]